VWSLRFQFQYACAVRPGWDPIASCEGKDLIGLKPRFQILGVAIARVDRCIPGRWSHCTVDGGQVMVMLTGLGALALALAHCTGSSSWLF
jgi:hypothetical protein